MAKSLQSITTGKEHFETVQRRLKSQTGGLGFWAAVDASGKSSFDKLLLARKINEKYTKKK